MARCDYFKNRHTVPAVDTPVALREALVGGRLAVETEEEREIVGLLPTKYLYLLKCMKQGFGYRGNVLASSGGKTPVVRVDLAPERKEPK